MNSFTAGPGELEYDDDYGSGRRDERVHISNKCRTEGCENRAQVYCQSCLDAHERRMLGPADGLRRREFRKGAA